MKIEYQLIDYPSIHEENIYGFKMSEKAYTKTEIVGWNACCNRMREFSDSYMERAFTGKDEKLCMVETVSYNDSADEYIYYPVDYCPFCGEKIEYVKIKHLTASPKMKVVGRIQMVEQPVKKTVFEEWEYKEEGNSKW
jgi:hypothetical protein